MPQQSFFPFYPEKILRNGLLFLGVVASLAVGFLTFLWVSNAVPIVSLETRARRIKENQAFNFSLGIEPVSFSFPLPNIEGELSFFFAPPRPNESVQRFPVSIKLKKSGQSKRVALPCRIDLQYAETLAFSDVPSLFWAELSSLTDHQIEVRVFVSKDSDKKIEAGSFVSVAAETPLQMAYEFPEGSPFRVLAEARWWGTDLFREKYGEGVPPQKLEIGPLSKPSFFELEEKDWIVWQEGKWQKINCLFDAKNRPIAHISFQDGRGVILEGWDSDSHIRIALPLSQPLSFKVKGDELFSSVRIRSEKQISCMLEKQCLILRAGDWVFKGENRWKVLKTKEEREAYLAGKCVGEIFVFDRIEMRGGNKFVVGHLFNSGRSQAVPVEVPVHSQRKNSLGKERDLSRKVKGK